MLITIYSHETMNHAQYVVFRLRGMTLLGQPPYFAVRRVLPIKKERR